MMGQSLVVDLSLNSRLWFWRWQVETVVLFLSLIWLCTGKGQNIPLLLLIVPFKRSLH
jgi:hypothetical protein